MFCKVEHFHPYTSNNTLINGMRQIYLEFIYSLTTVSWLGLQCILVTLGVRQVIGHHVHKHVHTLVYTCSQSIY